MKSNFDRCMNEVFAHEGGYVNDPHDTGGETNMGISKRAYPHEDIKGMTRARAAEIYRPWLACPRRPAGSCRADHRLPESRLRYDPCAA